MMYYNEKEMTCKYRNNFPPTQVGGSIGVQNVDGDYEVYVIKGKSYWPFNVKGSVSKSADYAFQLCNAFGGHLPTPMTLDDLQTLQDKIGERLWTG